MTLIYYHLHLMLVGFFLVISECLSMQADGGVQSVMSRLMKIENSHEVRLCSYYEWSCCVSVWMNTEIIQRQQNKTLIIQSQTKTCKHTSAHLHTHHNSFSADHNKICCILKLTSTELNSFIQYISVVNVSGYRYADVSGLHMLIDDRIKTDKQPYAANV